MAFDLSKPSLGAAGVAPYTVIYGQAGIGKTTFACMPPGTIVADIERGIPERLRNVPRFQVDSMSDLLGLIDQLTTQPHGYTHLVIDSVSALNQRLTDQVCREQKWLLPDGQLDMGEKGFGAYGRGEKIVTEKFGVLANRALLLKEKRNVAVTFLAHVRIAKVRPPDTDEYARYDLALPAGAIEILTQRADVVGFISYPIQTIKNDANRNAMAKAIGSADAVLYLRSAATHNAKNRFELPGEITIPSGNPGQGFAEYARRIPFFAPLFQAPTQEVSATPAAAA